MKITDERLKGIVTSTTIALEEQDADIMTIQEMARELLAARSAIEEYRSIAPVLHIRGIDTPALATYDATVSGD